nr:hypothetical protein [Gemmatimonadales bacterium]NIR00096.1 hypothetical protein [Gemmatimonadales bacterium]
MRSTAALGISAALVLGGAGGCAPGRTPSVQTAEDGVIVTPAEGPAALVRLQVINERIIRVTAT